MEHASLNPTHGGGVLDTTLGDQIFLWFAAGQWFHQGTLVSSINKTDRQMVP